MKRPNKKWQPSQLERLKQSQKAKLIATDFKKGINTLIDPGIVPKETVIEWDTKTGVFRPSGGGYIQIDHTPKQYWDLDMLKKLIDDKPMFKQEYVADFKDKKEPTNPIDDWCQKWIKNERLGK